MTTTETFAGSGQRVMSAQLRMKGGVASHTLTGHITLTGRSANFLSLDGGLSSRNVTLPVMTTTSPSPLFWIANRGSTNDLVIKNSGGSTVATLTPLQAALFAWDGTVWRAWTISDTDIAALTIGTSILLADNGVLAIGNDSDVTFTHSGTTVTVAGTKIVFSTGGKVSDDQTWVFGDDNDATIEYDENGTDQLRVAGPVLIVGTGQATGKVGVLVATNVADGYSISDGTLTYFRAVSTTNGQKGSVPDVPLELPKGIRRATYYEKFWDFDLAPSATLELPFVKDLHNTTTGDYLADKGGGHYRLATTAASEAEAAQITFGNQNTINLSKAPIVEIRANLSPAGAAPSADERWVVGVCDDHTNAEDSLDGTTYNTWLRIEGASLALVWEKDDNAANVDDQATGITLVKGAMTVFRFDFTDLAAVAITVDGVPVTGTVDMSGVPANTMVQPIVCYQRDAGSEVNTTDVDYVAIIQQRT